MHHNPLFIIPARGGSKGIPRKNIRDFCGRPLIAWSVDTALALAPPSHICLSTDDEEIAAVGRSLGLDVPYMRPGALATDSAGSREVIIDAMDFYGNMGCTFDCVVLLQPTSPLRTVDDTRRTIDLYRPDIDMVVTVTEASCNPYYNCFETDTDGYLHISKGDGRFTRRQDVPRAWEYNGAVYVINPDSIRRMALGEFPRRVPSPMPADRSVDLDTPLDWLIAETVHKYNAQR